ncbi:MAG: anti-sigma factor family protein [Planctomycetota bacterium]
MRCQPIQNRITAYLDGALSPSEVEQVGKHLTSCPECKAELAALEKTVELLDSWQVKSDAFRVDPGALAEKALSGPRAAEVRIPLRIWIAAGIAGAILGFVTGLFVESRTTHAASSAEQVLMEDVHPLPFDLSLIKATQPEEGR